jgi:ubiquinone/menaquinone biosynthesis C-methylase UbiE
MPHHLHGRPDDRHDHRSGATPGHEDASDNPFDDRAATWDERPAFVERARTIARAILDRVPSLDGARLLEYGAGTGLVTQGLLGHVGAVTLADTSSGMRGVIEAKIAAGGLPATARVWDLDLATDAPPDGEQIDLIVCALVLHHVDEVPLVLARFAQLLAAGGSVCIADLDHESGEFHGDGFAGHHGFHRHEFSAALEHAGFTPVSIDDCTEIERDGISYPVFLAVARR